MTYCFNLTSNSFEKENFCLQYQFLNTKHTVLVLNLYMAFIHCAGKNKYMYILSTVAAYIYSPASYLPH